jgi:hypothetical protein
MVECQPSKLIVEGSSPFTRSITAPYTTIMKIEERWIYISGSISNRDFDIAKAHFYDVQKLVEETTLSFSYIFNPITLPQGLTWNEYMRRRIHQLTICDAIVMLNGWEQSWDAIIEKELAEKLDIKVYFEKDLRSN